MKESKSLKGKKPVSSWSWPHHTAFYLVSYLRPLCTYKDPQNTIQGQTPSILLSRMKIFSGNSQFGRGGVHVQKSEKKIKYPDELCFSLWVKSSWSFLYPKLCLRYCYLSHWAVMPTCISTD